MIMVAQICHGDRCGSEIDVLVIKSNITNYIETFAITQRAILLY
jgi:hypothetical protein